MGTIDLKARATSTKEFELPNHQKRNSRIS